MNLIKKIHRYLTADIQLNPLRLNYIPVLRKELFVSSKLYLMEKSQTDGERDLINLSRTATRESCFSYYPECGLWIHIPSEGKRTIDTNQGNAEVAMSVDAPYLKDEIIEEWGLGKNPTEYHIHPDAFIDFYLEHIPERKSVPLDLLRAGLVAWPSQTDMETTPYFPDRDFKVASSVGITSYKLNSGRILQEKDWERTVKDHYNELADPANPDIPKVNDIPDANAIMPLLAEELNKELGSCGKIEFTPKSKI